MVGLFHYSISFLLEGLACFLFNVKVFDHHVVDLSSEAGLILILHLVVNILQKLYLCARESYSTSRICLLGAKEVRFTGNSSFAVAKHCIGK
jgi:hypothetical protein